MNDRMATSPSPEKTMKLIRATENDMPVLTKTRKIKLLRAECSVDCIRF